MMKFLSNNDEACDPTTVYFEFFESQNEAIDHCRRKNAGPSSKAAQFAIIDGPGCDTKEHPQRLSMLRLRSCRH